MATEEDIKIANATSRTLGAVGANAITPKYVESIALDTDRILDFGAGKDATHARRMNERGLHVVAHEFGDNFVPGIHTQGALAYRYDIVYASNVINVQNTVNMLGETIETLAGSVRKTGMLVLNYPLSPRKGVMESVDSEQLEEFLKSFFTEIDRVGGTRSAPLLRCTGVKR